MSLSPSVRRYYTLHYQLKLRQVCFADIARALHVSVGHITRVCRGERESPRVENYLRKLLGQDFPPPADTLESAAGGDPCRQTEASCPSPARFDGPKAAREAREGG